MQNLLTSEQMRLADKHTIAHQPIASIDLMENAANAFVRCFIKDQPDFRQSISICCGKGNNGGDGLAIARILITKGYQNIKVYIINFSNKQSDDFTTNLKRLEKCGGDTFEVNQISDLNAITSSVIIDAVLGSGLNKPLEGAYLNLASIINGLNRKVYAVDVPTGFFAEGQLPINYTGIKAYKTICFQRPKINFFFPESAIATEKFEVVKIGLDENFIQNECSDFFLVEKIDVQKILKPRKNFSHKGTFGHALIIAGQPDTMGAALLCSLACLHTGAGLITACIPKSGLTALNTSLPEVMALPRDKYTTIEHPDRYQAIAIGPGLGVSLAHEKLLENLIASEQPIVIDADALNILANRQDLLGKLTENSILTPHLKEFDRLFGDHETWWSRVQTAKKKAQDLKVIIVLKNQFTFMCLPDGSVYINPTGNPAMSQGGMGDVLTGVIVGFIAQKYTAIEAVMLACYIHGRSGDHLSKKRSIVTASSVAKRMSKEINRLKPSVSK